MAIILVICSFFFFFFFFLERMFTAQMVLRCDLLFSKCDKQLLEAILTLAMIGILVMVHLQRVTCDYLQWQLKVIAGSCCMSYH